MPKQYSSALLVFLLTTSFYLFTLSPSLAWGDGVRLQSEVISGESFVLAELSPDEFHPDPYPFARLGVTAWDHPLYIVLGHLLVKSLPFVDSLWVVNFISAFFGGASVALVFLLAHRFTDSLLASVYAALALAVSHTFWWHSSTPEVYTLFAFLLLSCIYFFDEFERTGNYRVLTYSTFAFGLALANHILAALAIPALGLYLLITRKFKLFPAAQWRKLILPVIAFLAGFSLYIFQFIRLFDKFALQQFAGSAVGSTFLQGLGAFSPLIFAESLLTYLMLLVIQFGPVGIVLGALGFRKIFLNADLASRKLVTLYIVYTLFGIFYRVTDQFAFFMTSHVFFALLIGMGVLHLFSSLKKGSMLLPSVLLFLPLIFAPSFYRILPKLMQENGLGDSFLRIPQIGTGLRNGLDYYINPNKRGDFDPYHFGEATVQGLAPDALVIAEWYTDTDEYFILRYFHKIENRRPDVTILGWPTADPFSFDPNLVLDVIEAEFTHRPIYLASLSERFYSASSLIERYCVVMDSNLYRLYPKGDDSRQCLDQNSLTE